MFGFLGLDFWVSVPGFGYLGLEFWVLIPWFGFIGLDSRAWIPGCGLLGLDSWIWIRAFPCFFIDVSMFSSLNSIDVLRYVIFSDFHRLLSILKRVSLKCNDFT